MFAARHGGEVERARKWSYERKRAGIASVVASEAGETVWKSLEYN